MRIANPFEFSMMVCMVLWSAAVPLALGGYTDVKVEAGAEHRIRYTSGNTIYVESLVDGRWVGRYWTADGRINVPYELYADDAFQIQVNNLWLSHGWQWVGAREVPGPR